jgi:hypothetical protein
MLGIPGAEEGPLEIVGVLDRPLAGAEEAVQPEILEAPVAEVRVVAKSGREILLLDQRESRAGLELGPELFPGHAGVSSFEATH